MRKYIMLWMWLMLGMAGHAQNWDYIRSSGQYYYGTATGEGGAATQDAVTQMMNMIVADVKTGFKGLSKKTSRAECLRSYSDDLKEVATCRPGRTANQVEVFLKKSDLDKMFALRLWKARQYDSVADIALQHRDIDVALQNSYWAYTLVRTLLQPEKAKSHEGKSMLNTLPGKIRNILNGVNVCFDQKVDNDVDLTFSYGNDALGAVDFSYNNGIEDCTGYAKDGRGWIEVYNGADTYRLRLEYEYASKARCDKDVESALCMVDKVDFTEANKSLMGRPMASSKPGFYMDMDLVGLNYKPQANQVVDENAPYRAVMEQVLKAISNRNYPNATKYFTYEAARMFDKLNHYGRTRVLGKQVSAAELSYYRGSVNGQVAVRGIQMAFTAICVGQKKTFVEDVIFTFDQDRKICNVSFGLGQQATDDIMKKVKWSPETRELLVEFMENYKTAYCLKNMDFLREVFAEDARIIVGNVLNAAPKTYKGRIYKTESGKIVNERDYTKKEFLDKLNLNFKQSEFINVQFANADVELIEKYLAEGKEYIAIRLEQYYNSTRYADKGFLMLIIDMTDHSQPMIMVRTWQPELDPSSGVWDSSRIYLE